MQRSTSMWTTCLLAVALLASCKKDSNPSTPSYNVPATYNFAPADSLKAKTILSMIGEMENLINTANSGATISASQLKGMYANTGSYFTDTTFSGTILQLNSSGISLQSLTTSSAQPFILSILDSIAANSASKVAAADGVAGVSERKTLLSANGIYWRQLFTKTMMGVVIGHLTTDVFLKDSLTVADNNAKAHAWDNAFFLWSVPANFPSNRVGVKYWGSYTSQIDSGLVKPVVNLTGVAANTTLLSAFTTGRAATGANDLVTAQKQAGIIINTFEKMETAAILHELNEAKGNLANGASAVVGNLSESLGFVQALKYNTQRNKVTDAQVAAIETMYGTNLYDVTPTQIDNIINVLSALYGWDSVKSYL
ncbi:protein of unknown function [Chitinophaga costaii]|uniref:DUF4856 domain-containing protein n=1 Tax=Chitinophaga costaii TaxID=1335309 RepID=A0A1C4EMZ3_9BACT|nr:DUF4856 domain-containing protein [Chitinophaga costaii]PUZ22457.1 DUF4856 domain-containing protein [Chitinophaga costaii]SCC44958.1 protein of unknown function [Chitinophaga costaii]